MIATIFPGRAEGTVFVPESKSEKHRILICEALAAYQNGSAVLACGNGDDDDNDDIRATKQALTALFKKQPMDCGASASTLRFLIPLALVINHSGTFFGTEKLFSRGIEGYEIAFSKQEVSFVKKEFPSTADVPAQTKPNLTIQGTLRPGVYEFPGDLSSQYISGMLFALPLLENDSELIVHPPVESRPYIRMTARIMEKFGVVSTILEETDGGLIIKVPGGQKYRQAQVKATPDWSGASTFLLLSHLQKTNIQIAGLCPETESLQGDSCFPRLLRELEEKDPVVDLKDCPDLAPNLFVAAALLHGATFENTRRLRRKESDRVAAMQAVLSAFGISSEAGENTVKILPVGIVNNTPNGRDKTLHKPETVLCGAKDHRIVMAASVLLTLTGGSVSDAEAVSKSFPQFFEELKKLGISARFLTEKEG